MSVAQGTVPGSGQWSQQTRTPAGETTQLWGATHRTPSPVQSRHTAPVGSTASGIDAPQSTAVGGTQLGQQRPASHAEPDGQAVPAPGQALPAQVSGSGRPQPIEAGLAQRSVHTHAPSTQSSGAGQLPGHGWPQPSSVPHATPAAQCGTQRQLPVVRSQTSWTPGQVPSQKPPQPSSAPQRPAAQCGTQVQRLAMQRRGGAHGAAQSQVGTQAPFWQSSPGAHETPAHGLGMQAPSRQISSAAQRTVSQGSRGGQPTWQVVPAPQVAPQGTIGRHWPRAGSQNLPAGQTRPLHGEGRQPAKQVPKTHVSRGPQLTPAHGSDSGTHAARQCSVAGSHGSSEAHGSG